MTRTTQVSGIRSCLPCLTDVDAGGLSDAGIFKQYENGEVIVAEGVMLGGLIFVLEGSMEVEVEHLGGLVPIRQLDGAQVIGEISWLDRSSTSARVTAIAPCQALFVERNQIEQWLDAE